MTVRPYSREEVEVALHKAAVTLIKSTPGATCLRDVQRIRNQPFQNLLAEVTELSQEQVWSVVGKPDEGES